MIAVVDYGMGNLRSVSKALEKLGADVTVTSSRDVLMKADGVVLPGVGAFYHAVENLQRLGLFDVIRAVIREGKPFLGICLGLQLLCAESEEGHSCAGLDVIQGRVRKFDFSGMDGNKEKVPHMGWSRLAIQQKGPLLTSIPDAAFMYFAHSYFVESEDDAIIAASTIYGRTFTSAVQKDNIFAVQFHPEKSGEYGLVLLNNFIQIANN